MAAKKIVDKKKAPKKGGKHLFKPGQSGNPNGRPKGRKNKLPRDIVNHILEVQKKLNKSGKSLYVVAKKNPEWFYEHFYKPLIPKKVNIEDLFDGERKITINIGPQKVD